jgi:putative endonuclease
MANHNELGQRGEELARIYLVSNGYKIRHTNYRVGKLELDIVAEKDEWLIVVEVRTRSTDTFIAPEETIDLRKIRNLVNAAGGYIRYHNWQGETRFDIITVIPTGDGHKIDHIVDAFLPPVN